VYVLLRKADADRDAAWGSSATNPVALSAPHRARGSVARDSTAVELPEEASRSLPAADLVGDRVFFTPRTS
jgi:hypothetical protein